MEGSESIAHGDMNVGFGIREQPSVDAHDAYLPYGIFLSDEAFGYGFHHTTLFVQ